MPSTAAEVCIVESLGFFDETDRKEGEIVARTLKLTGKSPHYSYVRSRAELEAFFKEYGKSPYRYLHLSCHGNKNGFGTSLEFVPESELVELLAPIKGRRRLFVSSCYACTASFGTNLVENSEWLSVLGPTGKIGFGDAAIFWTAFYHMMFEANAESMRNEDIINNVATCSAVVGKQQFRFISKSKDGNAIERSLP